MHSCYNCGIMIEQLLAENEGKTIEFKETARSLGGIMKTVVAFANSAGGTIIIGVKDKTKVLVGLPESYLRRSGWPMRLQIASFLF